MRSRAFTLIELLVVISIIALLSSVVLASLNSARTKGNVAAGEVHSHTVTSGLADSQVAIYDFDDCNGNTVTDLSGTGNTASIINSPAWTTSTYNGRGCALALNGSSQYATVPSNSSLLLTGPITVSAWFKKTNDPSTWALLVSKELSYQLMSGASGNLQKGQFALNIGGWQRVTTNTVFIPGQWYFIVGSYDGSSMKVYVNGTLDNQLSMSGSITTNGNPLELGGGPTGCGGCYHPGSIDEVHIYSRQLAEGEIERLYALGKSRHQGLAER